MGTCMYIQVIHTTTLHIFCTDSKSTTKSNKRFKRHIRKNSKKSKKNRFYKKHYKKQNLFQLTHSPTTNTSGLSTI